MKTIINTSDFIQSFYEGNTFIRFIDDPDDYVDKLSKYEDLLMEIINISFNY
jgi:hypothetical protein